MTNLKTWLQHHEGFCSKPYYCTTGHLTIGYGRNLEAKGISEAEASIMLDNDIDECINYLSGYTWFLTQPNQVRDALINMCFNLGFNKLLDFRKMIAALIDKDYDKAADEALNSKWASQVGERAQDVARQIRSGKDEIHLPNCS